MAPSERDLPERALPDGLPLPRDPMGKACLLYIRRPATRRCMFKSIPNYPAHLPDTYRKENIMPQLSRRAFAGALPLGLIGGSLLGGGLLGDSAARAATQEAAEKTTR